MTEDWNQLSADLASDLAAIVSRLAQVNKADAAVRSYAAADAQRFSRDGAND